jgi:hypothetical protein
MTRRSASRARIKRDLEEALWVLHLALTRKTANTHTFTDRTIQRPLRATAQE